MVGLWVVVQLGQDVVDQLFQGSAAAAVWAHVEGNGSASHAGQQWLQDQPRLLFTDHAVRVWQLRGGGQGPAGGGSWLTVRVWFQQAVQLQFCEGWGFRIGGIGEQSTVVAVQVDEPVGAVPCERAGIAWSCVECAVADHTDLLPVQAGCWGGLWAVVVSGSRGAEQQRLSCQLSRQVADE